MKRAFFQLHIAVLLAGFTAIFGKLITLNEGVLVWYRMLFSAVALGLILLFRNEFISISFSKIIKISSIGAIVALHWLCFYGSIKYANVSVSVTCLSAIGFFTSFMEPLIMRKRVDKVEVFLGLLAIAGIYLIFNFYPEYKAGIIFGIISAFLACLFPIFNKNLLKEFSPKIVTFYEMAGGFVALCIIIPFYLFFFPAKSFVPTLNDFLWLLVLSIVCTVFAFILSLNALKSISAFTVNLTYNFEPIYSIILAFLIFKENKFLGSGFYFGLGLILLAISLQMARVWNERKIEKNKELLKENNVVREF